MKAIPHPFPARMRLRFPQLKGAPLAAARFAEAVRQIDGVLAVEASVATGSVLVTYRVSGAPHFLPALERVLVRHGLGCRDEQRAGQAHVPGDGTPSNGVAARLVGVLVDTLVERSAVALVAALL